MKLIVLIACLCTLAFSEHVSYDGYQVFSVTPTSKSDAEFLATFEGLEGIDFWEQISSSPKPIRVMVAPEKIDVFASSLKANRMNFKLIIDNVEK